MLDQKTITRTTQCYHCGDDLPALPYKVKADDAAPGILLSAESIVLTFKTPATGTLKMVRNADKGMDRKLNIQTDPENRMVIPLQGFAKGRWRLILSWTATGKSYLYEKEVSF